MKKLSHLFDKNRAWSEGIRERDPEFFAKLSRQQTPGYLWIGCSDSRVPANQIVGLLPGEIFVHRNVANVVVHTDLNCLSAAQFAVDVLKVRHVIVCGHYGCGGVRAALRGDRLGLVDNWLRHVQDVRDKHESLLRRLDNEVERTDRLCELNVLDQVLNVCQTSIVRDAWQRGQELTVHSWIYALHDGRLRDLGMAVSSGKEVAKAHAKALAALASPVTSAEKAVVPTSLRGLRSQRNNN
jgi:carbonic anhydrase